VGAGSATFTATSTAHSNISASCAVTVTETTVLLTGITLSAATLPLSRGQEETLTVNYTPANTTEKGITWTSSNGEVATVSGGVVTAVGAGTATITATSTAHSNISASCVVTVTVPLVGISLNPASLDLKGTGSTGSFTVVYNPLDTTETIGAVTWASGDATIATVSDGTVTAVGAGTTTITATVNGKTASAPVTVTVIPPTKINLPLTLKMAAGSTYLQPLLFTPADTTETGLTWTSSDETVAKGSGGTIIAVGVGTARLTAVSTADPGLTATCDVTVLADYNGAVVNVVFEKFEDETITLPEPVSGEDKLTVTAPPGFDRYLWYLDSNTYLTETTSSTTDLYVGNYMPGVHYLTVIVEKDGYHFSKTLVYRVGY
jgi:uncharacterized protein YjdB